MPRDFESGRRAPLRRLLVGLKYYSPLLLTFVCVLLCALPLCGFDDGYDRREPQSVFGIASASASQSERTLADKGAEEVDVALAKRLRPLKAVVIVLFSVCAAFSLTLAAGYTISRTMEPESNSCNLFKVRFGLIFPGRWLHFLLLILPAAPTALPYYVARSFAEFYRVRGVEETAEGGQAPQYYSYSVWFPSVNPLIVAAILSAAAIILFIAVSGWERAYRLDLFTKFESEKSEKKRGYK